MVEEGILATYPSWPLYESSQASREWPSQTLILSRSFPIEPSCRPGHAAMALGGGDFHSRACLGTFQMRRDLKHVTENDAAISKIPLTGSGTEDSSNVASVPLAVAPKFVRQVLY